MMEAGRLEPTAVGEKGHAGVYAWAAHATDPQMTWRHVAAEHLATLTDPDAIAPYYNTVLALPYDPSPIRDIDPSSLEARAEDWKRPDGTKADAPAWAEAVFGGIDCQQGSLDDQSKPPRLEITLHVVGKNRRRAVIKHEIVASPRGLRPPDRRDRGRSRRALSPRPAPTWSGTSSTASTSRRTAESCGSSARASTTDGVPTTPIDSASCSDRDRSESCRSAALRGKRAAPAPLSCPPTSR